MYCDPNDLICSEFEPFLIGCMQTPVRGGYFCAKHQDSQISFNINGKIKHIDPRTIIKKRLSNIFR
jgi:hypothetical protein